MTSRLAATALVVAGVAGVAGCGGKAETCDDKVARLKQILAAPFDGTPDAHGLVRITTTPDGVGRTKGAIAVWFSPDAQPYVTVGTAEPTNWADGAGTNAILEDVIAQVPADQLPVIELELPHALPMGPVVPLLDKLSAYGTVHLIAAKEGLSTALPDAPAEVKQLIAWMPTVPEDQADKRFSEVLDDSMGGLGDGGCFDALQIGIRLAAVQQHDSFDFVDKMIEKITAGVRGCKCDKMKVETFGHLFRTLYTRDQVVWIAVRFAPGGMTFWPGRYAVQLIQGLADLDATTRAAGIEVTPP